VETILAIELFNAAQALEFRRPLKSSPVLEEFVAQYRKVVNFVEVDEVMYTHINNSRKFLQEN
jgi:histidine ammonia-lyase